MKYLLILLCISLLSCGGDTDYHFNALDNNGKEHNFVIHSRNAMLRPELKAGGCIGYYDSEEVIMCNVQSFTFYTTKP